ncbi:MAG: MarR family transcriptional regulator [Beijerinckiaceae bacterium]|nr:MarR family transcriptional regulator [Beijerinckiaceae bacterium]
MTSTSRTTPRLETPPADGLVLDRFLPYRLNVLANVMSKALARVYSDRWRISIPDWRVLATLAESEAMTQKAIGAHTHLDKTKMSRAVAHLESRGFIERTTNANDKREAFLTLTSAGRAVFEEIVPLAREFHARIEAQLTPEQLEAFDETITLLTVYSATLNVDL